MSAVDTLLPPGAASAPVTTAPAAPTHSVIDTLLPPGAPSDLAAGAVPLQEVPLPSAPVPVSKPLATAPAGTFIALQEKESVVTIGHGDNEVTIRKLSPEEKARRRRIKNLVMYAFGIILLVVVILIMTWGKTGN